MILEIEDGFGRGVARQRGNGNVKDKIIIQGARQHNLKNIDVEIPRNSYRDYRHIRFR